MSCSAILIHDGKVLLILRDNKPDIAEPNTWQLPGGGAEKGEIAIQTIQRELQEEIALVPKQLKYLGSAPPDTKVFFSPLTDDEVKNLKIGNEGQRLSFFSVEEALAANLTKKLRFYLESFDDGIKELLKRESIGDVERLGLAE